MRSSTKYKNSHAIVRSCQRVIVIRWFDPPNRNDTRGQHERKTQYADPWIAAGCISTAASSGISGPLRQNVPPPAGREIRHVPGGGGSEPPGAGTEDGRGL